MDASPAIESFAGSAPLDGRSVAVEKRSRRKTLTRVDMRSPLGMRIKELRTLFESVFPAGELSPIRRERIGEAAQLKALAETERGAWMRGEARCNLDELIRAERRAASAVKALGMVDAKPKPASTLDEYLTRRATAKALGELP
jgi:hypothetical protein